MKLPTRREWAGGALLGIVGLLVVVVAVLWWQHEYGWNSRPAVGYGVIEDDESQLVVYGGCNPEVRAAVLEETSTRVVVRLEVRGQRKGDCLQAGTISLSEPLGDRDMLDGVTREFLRLVES